MNAGIGRRKAVLLIGPTGSGKTPLGEYLAQHGLRGRRCHHFDFGANLRRAGEGVRAGELGPSDVAAVQRVLSTGALLEDHEFHIAARLLQAFVGEKAVGAADLVVLNGLPRHPGQARDIEPIVRVTEVVCLACSPEVVRQRIRMNSGGDRADRIDDAPQEVDNKLKIFEGRTAVLLDHYRSAGVPVKEVSVTVDTTPAEIVDRLSAGH
jgi:adenylate kinase family enzyme